MKSKTLGTIGLVLILSSFLFGVIEAIYFGHNVSESTAELICKSIPLVLCIKGSLFFITGLAIEVKKDLNKLKKICDE